ncbi:MAG TPA: tetratricopeptide repeat protein [Vicinamibacteria bacterium]|nr:tetratricopeptide repeat protein [Vicinamibacteria bacterium]
MSRKKKPLSSRGAPVASGDGGSAGPRRALFRAILFLSPLLVLFVLELLLRLVGYGVPMDFTLRQEIEGQPRTLSNPRFTWLFFEPGVARIASPFSLPATKPPGTYRVFVLGSSAAQGDPEPGFGIARVLEVLLRDQYPGVELEVTSAAATAVNSHFVYAAARACLRLEPDLLVVYAGNNEVVGPYGAGTVLTAAAPPLPIVRAAVAVRGTRLGQLVGGVARTAGKSLGRRQPPGAWHGMEMFLAQQVRRGDAALDRAYRNYEGNLADTCRLAREAGVPVVLSTVAVNLRNCGPFASPEASELYRQGRDELRLGRDDEARPLLAKARDLDTLRFRADTRTNAIVREVARREAGVRLVDAEEDLARAAPHGVPGDESFLDHVHLTFHGNYLLGMALLERVREALPEGVRRQGSGHPLPSEEETARRIVYTELDRYRIAETMQQRLRDAPFTNQPDHAEHVKRFADEIALLRDRGDSEAVDAAVKEYEQALAGGRAHWSVRERFATIERRLGNAAAAAAQWEILARQLPQYPTFQLQLSRALRDTGRFAEARAALQKVLDYQPDAPVTLVEVARLELAQGRLPEAKQAARRAVALDPRDANALTVLAASLCPRQQCAPQERAEAIGLLQRALEIAPESDAVRRDIQALETR